LESDCSLPLEFQIILAAEQPLATLYELKYVYSVPDVYDLLEMMQVKSFLAEQAEIEAKRNQK